VRHFFVCALFLGAPFLLRHFFRVIFSRHFFKKRLLSVLFLRAGGVVALFAICFFFFGFFPFLLLFFSFFIDFFRLFIPGLWGFLACFHYSSFPWFLKTLPRERPRGGSIESAMRGIASGIGVFPKTSRLSVIRGSSSSLE